MTVAGFCAILRKQRPLNRETNDFMLNRIREDIQTIFRRDPAARSVWEVLTYAGLWAVLSHRVAHRLWRRGLKFPRASFPRPRAC